ncbi:MAG: ParM/StbA family protein [Peptostreptococcaceae bacterium]
MKKIIIDAGNANYKILLEGKKIIDNSNVQEVAEGTFGAFEVNEKHYLFGEVAKAKRSTNKICETKRALLGRALFPLVEDKEKIEVVTLLPLSLYVNQENKSKYAELLKGKYTVTNPNGAKKSFTVTGVEVRAESFSSLATEPALLKEPIYLIDLGGVDVSGCFVNKTPDIGKSFTQEKGMNIFYSELGKVLTSKLLETYSDKDAELVFNKYDNLSDELKIIIDDFTKIFIRENIYIPLKEIGYRELIHKLVFTGGGSKALERYLVEDNNVTVLQNALWSNVEGAEILSKRTSK